MLGKSSSQVACKCLAEALFNHIWFPATHHSEVNNLAWHFLEDLFGKNSFSDGVIELDELDDISLGNFIADLEKTSIRVEILHLLEVSTSDSNNNN